MTHPEPAPPGAPARPLHVLLVEDDEVDVMGLRRAFRQNGIQTPLHVAGNGVDALALLRGGEVPTDRVLVLLDLNMPRMGGIELLQALRADPALSGIPVVVLTTSDDERDRVAARRLGAAGYLVKPIRFPDLARAAAGLDGEWTPPREE